MGWIAGVHWREQWGALTLKDRKSLLWLAGDSEIIKNWLRKAGQPLKNPFLKGKAWLLLRTMEVINKLFCVTPDYRTAY